MALSATSDIVLPHILDHLVENTCTNLEFAGVDVLDQRLMVSFYHGPDFLQQGSSGFRECDLPASQVFLADLTSNPA